MADVRISSKTVLAFAGFALAGVGGSGAVLVREADGALDEALVERQQLLAANRALSLSETLALAVGELQRMSDMAELDLADDDLRPEQRMLDQAYRQTPFLNGAIELYGPRGQCRWAEPDEARCVDRVVRYEPWFVETMSSGRPRRVYVSEADGSGLVDLVAPVRRDGRTVGVLRGVVDLSRDRMFSPSLREELPESTSIALLTADGRAVVRTGAMALAAAEALTPASRAAGGSAVVDSAGSAILSVWAPISGGELCLVMAWPLDALDDAVERQVRSLVMLMGLAALIAVIAGSIVASRLTAPLRRLAAMIRDVQASGRTALPASTRRDEVGDLQRAFRSLLAELAEREAEVRADRDRIWELADELEARVEDRTRELRDAQDALVRAEQLAAIGRAGTVLSHELRNSLNAISVAMDTLDSDESAPVRRQARRLVRGEVTRLRTLSDDLLTLAREPSLRPRDVEVGELLETAHLLVLDYAAEHDVEIELAPAPAALTARLDPDRMQSVLVNLLRNAVEAAAESGERRVRMGAAADGDDLEIRIEDSGRGVPPQIAERLFQPFVTGRVQGVGLGLAIAQRFAKALGGQITHEEGTLSGACFVVRVPLRTAAAEGSS